LNQVAPIVEQVVGVVTDKDVEEENAEELVEEVIDDLEEQSPLQSVKRG
jgi:hypothetical protein